LRDHRYVGDNPSFSKRELLCDITKSVFVLQMLLKSSKLMSAMLIEMNVKMAICDSAFFDLHRQEFHSIGE
jgi:hypothetical protein